MMESFFYLHAQKQKSLRRRSYPLKSEAEKPIRFAVRSLGWVEIAEEDLTPERSSKAVNKCILDLSFGKNDLLDVVGRWGDVSLRNWFLTAPSWDIRRFSFYFSRAKTCSWIWTRALWSLLIRKIWLFWIRNRFTRFAFGASDVTMEGKRKKNFDASVNSVEEFHSMLLMDIPNLFLNTYLITPFSSTFPHALRERWVDGTNFPTISHIQEKRFSIINLNFLLVKQWFCLCRPRSLNKSPHVSRVPLRNGGADDCQHIEVNELWRKASSALTNNRFCSLPTGTFARKSWLSVQCSWMEAMAPTPPSEPCARRICRRRIDSAVWDMVSCRRRQFQQVWLDFLDF